MEVTSATAEDLDPAMRCLAAAFAADPITRFLLGGEPGYADRLQRFFSLLMRARIALSSPVLIARGVDGVLGVAMGNAANPPPWPAHFEAEWSSLASMAPGFDDRASRYEHVAELYKPLVPHYYLGVIGARPALQGRGIGKRLIRSFCELSAADQGSGGVYLETANPANVGFYERAGFEVTGEGRLGDASLWCMFLRHERSGGLHR